MSGLDIIILATLVIGLWQGFNNGLMRSLVGLFGWLIALVCASVFAKPLAPMFLGVVNSPILSVVIAFLAVALTVIVILQVVLWVLNSTLKGLKLSFVDKLAGAVFACGKNLLVVMLMLNLIMPFVAQRDFWQKSAITQALVPYMPFAVNLSKRIASGVSESTHEGVNQLDKVAKP
ncbi:MULTISPECIES: CvpA family protein [unclassified Moraxella]|uniref:CvpA family protein n=1 Tax=unclassified Moraxella TaxID=2685852 RepID=UPI003AF8821B